MGLKKRPASPGQARSQDRKRRNQEIRKSRYAQVAIERGIPVERVPGVLHAEYVAAHEALKSRPKPAEVDYYASRYRYRSGY